MRTIHLLPLLLLSPLAAHAQVTLDRSGGGLPGTAAFQLDGTPGDLYVLVLATSEQTTPVGAVNLDVPLDLLNLSFQIPGLVGLLNPAGSASPSFGLPALPSLAGLTVSAQSLAGFGLDQVSNLVRLTLAPVGTFADTLSAPVLPIAGGAAVERADGTWLFAGGSGPLAQSYDPRLEQWDLAGASFGVGLFSQATALADGRILFTGGLDLTTGQPSAAAAIYDAEAGTTTELSMLSARAAHGASLLSNGRVMVTGGFQSLSIGDPTDLLSVFLAAFSGLLASTEYFDPTTETFVAGPNMLEPRAFHTSTALNNGDVLVAGGMTLLPIVNIPTVSSTAYQFVPALNSWGLPKFFSGARLAHSAVKLSDGSVLLVGGLTLDLTDFLTTGDPASIAIGSLSSVLRYTGGFFGGFSNVGNLSEPRAGAGLAALPSGGALIAGGFRLILSASQVDVGTSASADRYQLGVGVSPTGSMGAARLFPLLVPLGDSTVLVVGGGATDAEVYQL